MIQCICSSTTSSLGFLIKKQAHRLYAPYGLILRIQICSGWQERCKVGRQSRCVGIVKQNCRGQLHLQLGGQQVLQFYCTQGVQSGFQERLILSNLHAGHLIEVCAISFVYLFIFQHGQGQLVWAMSLWCR